MGGQRPLGALSKVLPYSSSHFMEWKKDSMCALSFILPARFMLRNMPSREICWRNCGRVFDAAIAVEHDAGSRPALARRLAKRDGCVERPC